MRKGKKQWLHFSNGMLSGVLALLGYTSCDGGIFGKETPDEYGTPYAKYEIKGKVTDEGQPVSDARIILRKGQLTGGDAIGFDPVSDTVYVGKDGTYLFEGSGPAYDRLRTVCEDPSGEYKSDSVEVTPHYRGGDGWYKGGSTDEVNFQLKKKAQ